VLRIQAYCLLRFRLADALEQRHGTEGADALFRGWGALAGQVFYKKYLGGAASLGKLFTAVGASFEKLGLGVFRVEAAEGVDGGAGAWRRKLLVTAEEGADCPGPPEMRRGICVYDQGFIRGMVECFCGGEFSVEEAGWASAGIRGWRLEAEGK
jgi:predicted hydrocarbon binding protein